MISFFKTTKGIITLISSIISLVGFIVLIVKKWQAIKAWFIRTKNKVFGLVSPSEELINNMDRIEDEKGSDISSIDETVITLAKTEIPENQLDYTKCYHPEHIPEDKRLNFVESEYEVHNTEGGQVVKSKRGHMDDEDEIKNVFDNKARKRHRIETQSTETAEYEPESDIGLDETEDDPLEMPDGPFYFDDGTFGGIIYDGIWFDNVVRYNAESGYCYDVDDCCVGFWDEAINVYITEDELALIEAREKDAASKKDALKELIHEHRYVVDTGANAGLIEHDSRDTSKEEVSSELYIISKSAYFNQNLHYDKLEFTWYYNPQNDGGLVVNSRTNEIIGFNKTSNDIAVFDWEILGLMGTGNDDPNVMYIHNGDLGFDAIIHKDTIENCPKHLIKR